MKSDRIEYLDAIKGFAILLVVMGHVDAACYEDWNDVLQKTDIGAMFWWKVIYSFHMPLFFCVSGYLCKSNGGGKFLLRKTRSLLLPFFSVGLTTSLLMGYYGTFTVPWFLRTLFIFICMNYSYDVINKLIKIKYEIVRVIYLYALFYVTYIIFHKYIYLSPIIDSEHFSHFNFYGFLLGIVLQHFHFIEKLNDRNWTFTIVLTYFIAYLTLMFIYKYYISYGYLAGVLAVWYLFKNAYTHEKSLRWWSFLGRHSLEIYLFHFFFIIHIPFVGKCLVDCAERGGFEWTITAMTIELLYSFAVGLIVIGLSLLMARLVSCSKLYSFLFLGKLPC